LFIRQVWPHSIVVTNNRAPQHLVRSVNFCNRSSGRRGLPIRDLVRENADLPALLPIIPGSYLPIWLMSATS
jgi:hypothetical protein